MGKDGSGHSLGGPLEYEHDRKYYKKVEQVDHPEHYNYGELEAIDVIEDWDLGFHLGNVVKYISRAGKKDKNTEIQDLKKALWYLSRKIEKLEKE